jgi:hypothetical protein
VLRGLDGLGVGLQIHVPTSHRFPGLESHKWLNPRSSCGSDRRRAAGGKADAEPILETFFEAFLQSFNHVLFLFSEFELRQRFNPREHTSDADLPIDIYLVLALCAKASVLQVEDVQNDW